jgi:hypothetical protein
VVSARVQAVEGSAVAEERDVDRRLAAVARELVNEPDAAHTLQQIVELGRVLAILTGAQARGPHACAGEVFGDRGQLAVGVLADLGQHGEGLV